MSATPGAAVRTREFPSALNRDEFPQLSLHVGKGSNFGENGWLGRAVLGILMYAHPLRNQR